MTNNKYKQHLENLLKQDARFIDDEGELMGNKVKSFTDDLDEKLIELLLQDEASREQFFIKIKDVFVFKASDFKFFLEQNKIDNSFTNYVNQIGLSVGGKFLKDNTDVVLDFPYKDCILEGGQSTEEGLDTYFEYDEEVSKTDAKKGYKPQQYNEKQTKRKEIFFNTIVAKDEIDRLLEPKAFANITKYNADGESKPTSFTRDAAINKKRDLPADTITDNLIIKGNNLLALHSLKEEFKGKVKLIYIDPPYNTNNDSFTYNDSFNHSTWLTFMYNRLLTAKELLKQDGLIMVQMDTSRNSGIGSSELGYLNLILDEIFNRKNFIANLHWKKKKQPSFLSRVAAIMESILVYAKSESYVSKLSIEGISDSNKPVINSGNSYAVYQFPKGVRVRKDIEIIKKGKYVTRSMSVEYLNDVNVVDGRTTDLVKVKAQFRTSEKNIKNYIKQDLLFITSNLGLRRDLTDDEKGKSKAITDLLLDWGQNQDADNEIKKIFNIVKNDKFSNPKPELLIHNLILSCTNKNDIILDYHLGSGTTAAVAHKMNRQYIGIEQMSSTFEDVLLFRLCKVISSDDLGVSNKVNWKGGGSFIKLEIAKNNQNAKDEILACNSYTELLELFNKLYTNYFLHYNLKIKEFKEVVSKEEKFKALPLDRQKEIFCKMLDNNQLYVNVSEMEDSKHNITTEDIALTKDFYQIKE